MSGIKELFKDEIKYLEELKKKATSPQEKNAIDGLKKDLIRRLDELSPQDTDGGGSDKASNNGEQISSLGLEPVTKTPSPAKRAGQG